jgi:transposase/DNA replication protein DnaC
MAAERLSMRQIREILRQKWTLGRSHREVAEHLRAGLGTVSGVERRARAAGLDWPQVEALSDEVLEARLYGAPTPPTHHRPVPDCALLHAERHKPGVTLELLHLEYLEQHPDGYRYTQFCELYRRWLHRRGLSMRQVHHAGDKCFVDYAGQKPRLIEPATGELIEVELFVAVLGASNYTYAEATRTQQVPDWLASHQRAFQFFGGVTTAVVCDQLKSGVTFSCRYEPGLQRTYEEFAQHYGTVILPARPAKPRDKPKIEVAVQVVERWILARLRHETFFALAALNARIAELLADLNARPMRLYRASRSELFARLDQPALRPLPAAPFVYGEWKIHARVNIDYHIELRGHYYSVPYALIHEPVDARLTATTVECFHRGQRVAVHVRSHLHGRHTTDPAHMPKAHQRHLEWTPSRLTTWARTIGPQTAALVQAILADRPHPEQGYRSCLGLLRLGTRYGELRLEAACTRAVAVGARSYRHVDSMLKHGLDRLAVPEASPQLTLPRPTTISAGRPSTSEGDPPMLTAPTMEHLQALKLDAMAAAWTAQQHQADLSALAFDERFGLLVEAEWGARKNKRLVRALQEAKLKLSQACLEAIDYPARRELDKAVVRQLATCRWVAEHHNVILVGATGVGKSFIACALAHQACRKGYRAGYRRASRLFHELTLARADGTYIRLLGKLARLDVLVIDDWGLAPVQDPERRDLLEILEDRYGTRSTIITSQLPPAQWHDYLADATLADAICDRLLHNAHRIVLKGPSRRKEAKLDD